MGAEDEPEDHSIGQLWHAEGVVTAQFPKTTSAILLDESCGHFYTNLCLGGPAGRRMYKKRASMQGEMFQIWRLSHCQSPLIHGPHLGVGQEVTVKVLSKGPPATFSAHGVPQGTELLAIDICAGERILELPRAVCPVYLM
jgi:hypothetical protein